MSSRIDLNAITIDPSGRVVLSDAELIDLEATASNFAGGNGTNSTCDGNNAGCHNTVDCSGSSNLSCRNSGTCYTQEP